MAETPLQVSVKQAAAMIGVCRQTLYRMRDDNQIVFNKVRGRTLVPMSEVKRLSDCAIQNPVGEPVVEPPKYRIRKRKLFPNARRI